MAGSIEPTVAPMSSLPSISPTIHPTTAKTFCADHRPTDHTNPHIQVPYQVHTGILQALARITRWKTTVFISPLQKQPQERRRVELLRQSGQDARE